MDPRIQVPPALPFFPGADAASAEGRSNMLSFFTCIFQFEEEIHGCVFEI